MAPRRQRRAPATPAPAVTPTALAPAAAVRGKAPPPECKIWGDALAPRPAVPGGVARQQVRATYHYYSPAYDTATLACADKFWATPDYGTMLLQYPWTAYCVGPFSQGVCGKCLRVTNRRTGAAVTARAVDNGGCSDTDGTGLDLDPCAFNAIDTDGQGYRDGHMRVDVQEVEC